MIIQFQHLLLGGRCCSKLALKRAMKKPKEKKKVIYLEIPVVFHCTSSILHQNTFPVISAPDWQHFLPLPPFCFQENPSFLHRKKHDNINHLYLDYNVNLFPEFPPIIFVYILTVFNVGLINVCIYIPLSSKPFISCDLILCFITAQIVVKGIKAKVKNDVIINRCKGGCFIIKAQTCVMKMRLLRVLPCLWVRVPAARFLVFLPAAVFLQMSPFVLINRSEV